jgi:hypothetical protein
MNLNPLSDTSLRFQEPPIARIFSTSTLAREKTMPSCQFRSKDTAALQFLTEFEGVYYRIADYLPGFQFSNVVCRLLMTV